VLPRAAAGQLVHEVVPALPPTEAGQLAEAVGDLSVVAQQAAGLLAETGMSVEEYLTELTANPVTLFGEGPTGRYPRSLAAVVTASLRHLTSRGEAAGRAHADRCHPRAEPLPLTWRTGCAAGTLPHPLDAVAASTTARRRRSGRVAAFGLARVGTDTLQVHRLTQAVIAPIFSGHDIDHADRLLATRLCSTNATPPCGHNGRSNAAPPGPRDSDREPEPAHDRCTQPLQWLETERPDGRAVLAVDRSAARGHMTKPRMTSAGESEASG
jgi:hypothetical protein